MPGLEPTRNSALKIAVVCFPTEPRHLAFETLLINLIEEKLHTLTNNFQATFWFAISIKIIIFNMVA